jgi:hypothetical protein
MNLRQIGYFLALCEEQNSTRAARRWRVLQPSLTNAIKALETTSGGQLFDRKPFVRTITGARMNQWDEARQVAAPQVHAAALPLASERAGEPRWRPAAVRSVQGRRDVPEFDKCEVGRDAYPAYNHREVGIGPVFVASAWLAFYVIAAIRVAFGN